MGGSDSDRVHERAHIVGDQFGGIGAGRFVGLAGAARIDRDAREVPRVLGDLEGVTGVIGRQIWDQDQRFSGSLSLVVDRDAVGGDLGHLVSPFGYCSERTAGREVSAFLLRPEEEKREPRSMSPATGTHLALC